MQANGSLRIKTNHFVAPFGVLNSRFTLLTRLKSERKLSNRKRTDFLTTLQDVVNSCTAIVAI
jgi:hypothetical protein